MKSLNVDLWNLISITAVWGSFYFACDVHLESSFFLVIDDDLDIPRLEDIMLPDSFNRVKTRNVHSSLLLSLVIL